MKIFVAVEGESDEIFFKHFVSTILGRSDVQIQREGSGRAGSGISVLLDRLPQACKLLGSHYQKVIAIFDEDKINEPHTKNKSRKQYLTEILQKYKQAGGFPVRQDLEDLIEACLPADKKGEFREKVKKSKLVAAKWALPHLDKEKLKNKLVDLERALDCQLRKDF